MGAMVDGVLDSLGIQIGEELPFVLERWPRVLSGRLSSLLRPFLAGDGSIPAEPSVVRWGSKGLCPRPGARREGTPGEWIWHSDRLPDGLAFKASVRVSRRGFDAEVVMDQNDFTGAATDELVFRLLPAVLGELALLRGWVLLHAAGICWREEALVLPGESGSGKSTIAVAAASQGWPVLSEDLAWIRVPQATTEVCRVVGFPRPGIDVVPFSEVVEERPVRALVFPSLAPVGENVVERLSAGEVVRRLNDACVALGSPFSQESRFQAIARLANTVSGFDWRRSRVEGKVP